MKRIFGISLLIISVFGFLVILYLFYKPHRDISNETALALAADSLFKAYENENDANALYLDKALIVSGFIHELSVNQQGEQVVVLKTGDPLFGVACTLRKGQEVSSIKGEKISLKGICSGYTGDVVLRDCIVVTP